MSAHLAALSGLRCMTFRLVKSLYLAHQSSRHRKDTRNKALDLHTEDIAPMSERLDCRRISRRRKAFRADLS